MAYPAAVDSARPTFALKAEIRDPTAHHFAFPAHKTMYGGKHIKAGDTVFLFASENEGGHGLIARGTVTESRALPKCDPTARETPRVSVSIAREAMAVAPLGRTQLRGFSRWDDGRPESELNFKLYRQATNKIVGLSAEAGAFLAGLFPG